MIPIKVILENNKEKDNLKKRHGLAIYIDYKEHKILLDVGPDGSFIHNAREMGEDISKVDTVVLSHSHIDHVGGLNSFVEVNNDAKIFLMDKKTNRYYTKFLGFLKIPIGLKCNDETLKRITEVNDDTEISKGIYFIKNKNNTLFKSEMNRALLKKYNNKFIEDDFDHEGILVLEDDNELVVFCSCSHNGVSNIIESVKQKFPGKKIRSFIGGMHLYNPVSRKVEAESRIDKFSQELLSYDNIMFYTGHCTGKKPFALLKSKLGDRIKNIETGTQLEV